MMNHTLLYQFERQLSAHLPSLNSWQQANVALFSYGVIQAKSCQQGALASQINGREHLDSTVRRWHRWLDNEGVPLEAFFSEWSRWVVEAVDSPTLSLVVDETKLGDRIGVMMVGLAWQGRCLPLAWRTYPANDSAAYPAEGQVKLIEALLKQIKTGIGSERAVLVLADRGIGCSPDLCRAVAQLGWHYLFRVTCQTKIVTRDGAYTIAQQVQPGDIWMQAGKVFKRRGRIPAHARAIWTVGYAEPWALVTNDAQLTGYEYARRNWQEQSFRDLKSGGWRWGESRIRHADHVARLLVVLAIAYGWMVAFGSQAVEQGRCQALIHTKAAQPAAPRRHWSLFKEGLRFWVEVIQRQTVCPPLHFIPDKRFT